MAGAETAATAFRRIKELTERVEVLEDQVNALSAPFAWYWDSNEDRKFFAVIMKIEGSKADLMIMGSGSSGGVEFVRGAELHRAGKPYEKVWRPFVMPIVRQVNLLSGAWDEAVTETATTT